MSWKITKLERVVILKMKSWNKFVPEDVKFPSIIFWYRFDSPLIWLILIQINRPKDKLIKQQLHSCQGSLKLNGQIFSSSWWIYTIILSPHWSQGSIRQQITFRSCNISLATCLLKIIYFLHCTILLCKYWGQKSSSKTCYIDAAGCVVAIFLVGFGFYWRFIWDLSVTVLTVLKNALYYLLFQVLVAQMKRIISQTIVASRISAQ